MTTTTTAALRDAVRALRQYSTTRQQEQQQKAVTCAADDEDDDTSYVAELRRLQDATRQHRRRCAAADAHGGGSSSRNNSSNNNSSYNNNNSRSSHFLPALSLRARDPIAEELRMTWRETTKAVELTARFALVEQMEQVHATLSQLLLTPPQLPLQQQQQQPQPGHGKVKDGGSDTDKKSNNNVGDNSGGGGDDGASASPPCRSRRTHVTMREYLDVLDALAAWRDSRDDVNNDYGKRDDTAMHASSSSPHVAAVVTALSRSADDDSNDSADCSRRSAQSQQPYITTTTRALGERLYAPCIVPRWPGAELFLTCIQQRGAVVNNNNNSSNNNSGCMDGAVNEVVGVLPHSDDAAAHTHAMTTEAAATVAPHTSSSSSLSGGTDDGVGPRVDVALLCDAYAKHVALLRCEAELLLYDGNHDGRLAEDEVEAYVRALVPRVTALRELSDELLPFYCCTASRRLFYELDGGNRGVVRVDALVGSAVMDEWLSLQLARDGSDSNSSSSNWFSASVTRHVYDKFVALDTRNASTLNLANMQCYKKGLPTVVDDGLPHDVSPLSALFVQRYFETHAALATGEVDYRRFVDFVLAVELLPRCRQPLFFWRILDLYDTGVLTPLSVHGFARETHAKLVTAGLHVAPLATVLQELFDLIATAAPLRITRDEFVRAPQAGLFVALVIDCLSFWAYENREQR